MLDTRITSILSPLVLSVNIMTLTFRGTWARDIVLTGPDSFE